MSKKLSVDEKREREQQVVSKMIDLYCRKKHKTKGKMCPDCQALKDYAELRISKCPFMETKTFCSNCKVHCYNRRCVKRYERLCVFQARE